jgi:predicted enzyme related to lactoylglutathione lyase
MEAHDNTKSGEFCWNELLSSDHRAGFAFYAKLFGWEKLESHDMGPMGEYLLFGSGGARYGGMFTKGKDIPTPPCWMYYVQSTDLDGALARARARGAKVLNGPMDVPGGARIVQMLDPQGAVICLHELAKNGPARTH